MAIQTVPMDMKLNMALEPNPDFPIIYNQYEMLIQEIDVLFSTDQTEVICGGTEWANLKQYVFSTNVSESTLSTRLEKLIYSECPSSEGIPVTVQVQFYHGTIDDIAIITVTITENSTIVNQKQYYVG